MEKPLVSIIIRTHNEERWIGSCLNSVFSQDFKDFEVIVVDDNSQDRTVDKAKKFQIKLVHYTGKFIPEQFIYSILQKFYDNVLNHVDTIAQQHHNRINEN